MRMDRFLIILQFRFQQKNMEIPGIIVEHAFVTNSSDVNNYLNNEAGLKKLGVADATGIMKYFGLEKERLAERFKRLVVSIRIRLFKRISGL